MIVGNRTFHPKTGLSVLIAVFVATIVLYLTPWVLQMLVLIEIGMTLTIQVNIKGRSVIKATFAELAA